jgi:hypothetical protein
VATLTCTHCHVPFDADTHPHTKLELIVKGDVKMTVYFASIVCLWEWACLVNMDSEDMVRAGLKRDGTEVLQ